MGTSINKGVFNIVVKTAGRITAMPGFTGPILLPFKADVLVIFAIFKQGHAVDIETLPDKYVTLNLGMVKKMMNDYGVTDADLTAYIKEAERQSALYLTLSTIKALADAIIRITGVPVAGYENLGAIGLTLKAILNDPNIDSFHDVAIALNELDARIDDIEAEGLHAIKLEVEDLQLLTNKLQTDIAEILVGVDIRNFADVETALKAIKDDYGPRIQHIEDTFFRKPIDDARDVRLVDENIELPPDMTDTKDVFAAIKVLAGKLQNAAMNINNIENALQTLTQDVASQVVNWEPNKVYESNQFVMETSRNMLYIALKDFTSSVNLEEDITAGNFLALTAGGKLSAAIKEFVYRSYSNVYNSISDTTRTLPQYDFTIPIIKPGDIVRVHVNGFEAIRDIHYVINYPDQLHFLFEIDPDSQISGEVINDVTYIRNLPAPYREMSMPYAAMEWEVVHNFGFKPVLKLFDEAGVSFETWWQYTSENTIFIRFSEPIKASIVLR